MILRRLAALAVIAVCGANSAMAAEIRVLTAGAFRSVLNEFKTDFEKQSGHTLAIDYGTAGQISERIGKGEPYDVVVTSTASQNELFEKGKLAKDSKTDLAHVGIGVMVRNGLAKPDIATVDAFRKALIEAKSLSHVDPGCGGTSGIYLTTLFVKWGIANQLKQKLVLKCGGHVADILVAGAADLGLQQISEIVPVKEVTFVGPLPEEIQTYTVYTGAVHVNAKQPAAAKQLLAAFRSERAGEIIKAKGMEPGGK